MKGSIKEGRPSFTYAHSTRKPAGIVESRECGTPGDPWGGGVKKEKINVKEEMRGRVGSRFYFGRKPTRGIRLFAHPKNNHPNSGVA